MLPLAVVILGAFGGIVLYGYLILRDSGQAFSFISPADIGRAFGAVSATYQTGGVMKVLFLAAVAGSLTAIAMSAVNRLLTSVRRSAVTSRPSGFSPPPSSSWSWPGR